MKTVQNQAAKRLFKKLSALRATLPNDERAILDNFIIVEEVAAHKMTGKAAGKAVGKANSKAKVARKDDASECCWQGRPARQFKAQGCRAKMTRQDHRKARARLR